MTVNASIVAINMRDEKTRVPKSSRMKLKTPAPWTQMYVTHPSDG